MATPVSNAVGLSGDPRIDGLIQGSRWQFSPGSNVITYSLSLNDTPGTPQSGPVGGFFGVAVSQALAAWSNVANIQFVQRGSGTVFTQSTADIAFTLTGDEIGTPALAISPSPAYADAFFAGTAYTRSVYPRPEGDVSSTTSTR